MGLYDCVIFVAHPDDAFLGMGGTMAKFVSEGKKILLVCASHGENGNAQSGNLRLTELKRAAVLCGIDYKVLAFTDGEMMYSLHGLHRAFSEILVTANPLLIATHHPCDAHSDHQAVYRCGQTAMEHMWHLLKGTTRLCHSLSFSPIRINANNLGMLKFNIFSDISEFSDQKTAMISCHQSQQPYLQKNINKHRALSSFLGSLCDCAQAEGFYEEKQQPTSFQFFHN